MTEQTLELLKHEVHYIALSIMGIVYVAKVIWILKFKPMKERTPSKGNKRKAIMASYFCIATPWGMESTKRKPMNWIEFAVFHIGIAFAIIVSFMYSFGADSFIAVQWFRNFVTVIYVLSFIITLYRLLKRIFSPVHRVISHPDDYFSIAMMVLWFAIATLSILNMGNTLYLGLYLGITAFLIAYVPFSKMSHYIMWPFTRYYFGKHFGHRGVYPKIKE
jgi:hypothetical protein